MRRRLVQGTAAWLAGCAAAPAVEPPRVGLLFPGPAASHAAQLQRFEAALRALGLEPGVQVLLDVRHGDGDRAALQAQARALAARAARVCIGFTLGPTEALGQATAGSAVPILFVAIGDPVARGLVANLQRPGGRFSGSTDLVPDAARHRMDLLAQVLPAGSRRVAVISNAAITPRPPLDAAAARHGMGVLHVDVRDASGFAPAYALLEREQPHALLVTPNAVTFEERHRLAAWGRARRVPVLFGWREFMDAGGLLSLGANTAALDAVAAQQLAQLLQGAAVAELPVATPRFDLVVDLGTARAIGLMLPAALIARADQVIGA